MSADEIRKHLVDVLKQVSDLGGHEWAGIAASKKPIGDLIGFDSLCSIEATVLIEEKLGCERLCDGSLFISEDGCNALTVQEVVERIQQLVTAQQKEKK